MVQVWLKKQADDKFKVIDQAPSANYETVEDTRDVVDFVREKTGAMDVTYSTACDRKTTMSTEHDRYVATCQGCGHTGVWIERSDDWGHGCWSSEGFDAVPPAAQAVLRKRTSAYAMSAGCPNCGSSDVVKGAFIEAN